jgi:hypothetical protein
VAIFSADDRQTLRTPQGLPAMLTRVCRTFAALIGRKSMLTKTTAAGRREWGFNPNPKAGGPNWRPVANVLDRSRRQYEAT